MAQENMRWQAEADRKAKAAQKVNFDRELALRLPAGFKGIVLASLVVNETDTQSDYWGHRNIRQVVIGFTKSSRSLFGNMRKAAATFAPTRHLSERNPEFEHRDNYSMGAGMYLKDGWTHDNGWTVEIDSLEWSINASEFSYVVRAKYPEVTK